MATSTPVPSVPAVSQVLAPVSVTPSDCSAVRSWGSGPADSTAGWASSALACAWGTVAWTTPSISPITVPPASVTA